jgi:general secretion pathway protein D
MPDRLRRGIALLLVAALAAGLASSAAAQDGERRFQLNYKRVTIEKLIERVASETRRPILFDEQVRGNISIVTKRPVTEDEAWAILDASLSLLGFSLLPSTADMWRISRVAEAIGEAPFEREPDVDTDNMVTTLIPLVAASPSMVMGVLEPLSGARATLVPFEQTNCIIASGPERIIARLTAIADELDQIDEFDFRTRVFRYRNVSEIEPVVEARIEALGISERTLQVWSDQRTNSFLYRGSEEEASQLARFLDRLDKPVEGRGRIQILRVLNRDPEEVAELIQQLAQGAPIAEDVELEGLPDEALVGADFTLAVDRASRSLVVGADEATHAVIRRALEILDVQPQQVAIDVTVSELRTPRNFELGFGFALPFSSGNDLNDYNALVVSGSGNGVFTPPDSNTTFFGRVAHDNGVPFTIDGGNGVEIPIVQTGVIRISDFEARTNVLIQPSLVVTSGERHEIFVGNNFPVPISEAPPITDPESDASGVQALARSVTFERTDVGTTLGLEVRAGREGKIQVELDLELSRIAPSIAGSIEQVGPTFINQTLSARARLDDGQTAIVAVSRQGLENDASNGVPWLSKIPFFGWLFRTDQRRGEDVRLVIAARARRIGSPADLVADSIRRRLAFQRSNARGETLPQTEGPPFAVRVTTRSREDDARAIADGLTREGYATVVHPWSMDDERFFDVYVVSLDSMADAAEIATVLADDGWESDLVVLPTRS